jgi:protein O-GlcNAc transferase
MDVTLESRLEQALDHHQQGRVAEARIEYEAATKDHPNSAEAWHLLGVCWQQMGDDGRAIEAIGRAISLDASQSIFFNNLGVAYQSSRQPSQAMACFRAAVQIKPKNKDAQLNLIRLLAAAKQLEQAFEAAQSALTFFADSPELCAISGGLALQTGRADQAVAWYEQGLKLLSGTANRNSRLEMTRAIVIQLAQCNTFLNKPEEAAHVLKQHISIDQEWPEGHYELGRAKQATEDTASAIKHFQRASKLRPTNRAWSLRKLATCPYVFSSVIELDEYRATLGSSLRELQDSGVAFTREELINGGFVPPYALAYQGRCNRELREQFAAICRRTFQKASVTSPRNAQLRIGFVVTRGHEAIFARCCAGFLRHMDRRRFEPILICDRHNASMLKQTLAVDVPVVGLGSSFEQAVADVQSAKCDALYFWEVGSDAMNYYLPFLRLAPVQCTSWSTQVTSGVREVDYYLSSRYTETAEADANCTETLWRLPTLPTFQTRIQQPDGGSREQFGFSAADHLYLCPQTLWKIHPDQDAAFAEILNRDPAAIIVLKGRKHPYAEHLLRQRFKSTIPNAHQRIQFLPWLSEADHYRLLVLADVILDPIHFSAGSSAYDIFSFNLPVVTIPGPLSVSRYTAACYERMGLPELVVQNRERYVDQAIGIASNSAYRADLRRKLAETTDVLFEDMAAVHALDQFFAEAIERRYDSSAGSR